MGRGLYLQVTPGKFGPNKSWIFRYEVDGRDRYMGLGSTLDVSLFEAREKASQARKLRREGLDPLEEKRAGRAAQEQERARAITFAQAAERCVAAHRAGWRSQMHGVQWLKSLTDHAMPLIGALPVARIDTPLVLKVLQPIWQTKTESASRVRGRIEAVLDWAKVSGLREGENPARWKGHLDHLLPKPSRVTPIEHHAALPYTEIGAFLVELRERATVPAAALEFAILTAARTGEVLGAQWGEIDGGVWTIPGDRTKTHREHRVPLAPAALAVLDRQERRDGFVFSREDGTRLNKNAMLETLWAMGRRDLTVHGFRSTFRDWAGEHTNFPRELAEAALAHVVGDKAEQAYRRGDALERRRKLMTAWAAYCAKPATSGEVMLIRAVAS